MDNDTREECVMHANCQAEPLSRLLMASPEFAARWRVRIYTNYTRDAIPAAVLKNATLFLYQHLGPEWEELRSEALLARTGGGTRPVCIPNMFFLGYWPFWTGQSPMEFGDYFLDKLYEAGAGKPEILRIYLRGDVTKMADLDAAAGRTLEAEFVKEERCAVKTASFVAEHWKKIRLFQTVNHPDKPLLLHAAQGLLAHLGLAPLSKDVCDAFSYDYEGFCLPVHPGVAAFHNLPFAGEGTLYPVFGRGMTFAQYVSRYIDCRMNQLEETFLGYLQMV
jgi:hypothetical protein